MLASPTFGPTWDITFFLERYYDPSFLVNDFTTNITHEKSPRIVYFQLIANIGSFLNISYYNLLYYLVILINIALPVSIFMFLSNIKLFNAIDINIVLIKDFFLAIFIMLAGLNYVNELFSVASWRVLSLWPNSQSYGLLLSFISGALIVFEDKSKLKIIFATIFLTASFLIHISNAILFSIFLLCIILVQNNKVNNLKIILFSFLFSFFILKFFYIDDFVLDADLFLQYFIYDPFIHHHHYVPGLFGPDVGKDTWVIIMASVAACLSMFSLIGIYFKNKIIMFVPLLFIVTYTGSAVSQIFFTKYFPIREIIALGPIRYTQFDYYILIFIFSSLLALILNKMNFQMIIFFRFNTKKYFLFFILTILLLPAIPSSSALDYKNLIYKEHKVFFDWVSENTDEKDVFSVPFEPLEFFHVIPIVGKRSVYYGNTPSYNDKFMQEFSQRQKFTYGHFQDWDEGGPQGFYCNHNTKSILDASKKFRLNWFIQSNKCAEKKLIKLPVFFSNNNFTVYKVN